MKKYFNYILVISLVCSSGAIFGREGSGLKNLLLPASEILTVNGFVAACNRFVFDADYARISFSSIESNFNGPWVWDDDNFAVNQIGHPYQGSLYYSLARHYGHGYFKSMFFASFGSAQWEYFMETEKPAINDLITTSLGGAMLGEITGRLSENILDDTSDGLERAARETGAFIINPMKGLHRMISGSMFRIRSVNDHSGKKVKFEISGEKKIYSFLKTKGIDENKADSTTTVPFANYNFQMIYGEPFSSRKPLDYFSMNFGLSFRNDIVANVTAKGLLWKKNVRAEKYVNMALGMVQNFDYITSQTYKLAESSFGIEFMAERICFKDWHFLHNHQVGLIALGGASTEYFVEVERNYNFGPGAIIKMGFAFYKDDFAKVTVNIDRFWIRTLSGAEGVESVGVGRFEAQKNIYKGIGAAVSYVFYDREGVYLSYPDVQVFNHEIRGMITYNFY